VNLRVIAVAPKIATMLKDEALGVRELEIPVPWNLAKGIPYPEGSVDAVFHEHFLEHLPMPAGVYDGESRIRPCPDDPERFGSAWVEAVA
jgi:hypothetical protein